MSADRLLDVASLCRQAGESVPSFHARISGVVHAHGFDHVAASILCECMDEGVVRIGRVGVIEALLLAGGWGRS